MKNLSQKNRQISLNAPLHAVQSHKAKTILFLLFFLIQIPDVIGKLIIFFRTWKETKESHPPVRMNYVRMSSDSALM